MLSGRHPASSSLQDLVEAVGNEYGHGRRLHYNPRQKKYSSVSSRERESGSLPINVNSNLSPHEASFMMEYKRGKNKLAKMQLASNCVSTAVSSGPLLDAAFQAAAVEVDFPIVENLEIKVWIFSAILDVFSWFSLFCYCMYACLESNNVSHVWFCDSECVWEFKEDIPSVIWLWCVFQLSLTV